MECQFKCQLYAYTEVTEMNKNKIANRGMQQKKEVKLT